MKNAKRTVIGISGASCSGKSWFAQKIKEARPDSVSLFDLDSYYRHVDYVNSLDCRHDNPEAIDFDKVLQDLSLLLDGHEIRIPVYDFDSHSVVSEKVSTPAPIVIVEGLFVFANKALLGRMDMKIWIEAADDLRFDRRMNRDTGERGRNAEEVTTRYASDVKPGYEKYIRPCREHADLVYPNDSGDSDSVSALVEIVLSFHAASGVPANSLV